jgi:DNA-directed RNA polymerase subunit RPC12/RpoP
MVEFYHCNYCGNSGNANQKLEMVYCPNCGKKL